MSVTVGAVQGSSALASTQRFVNPVRPGGDDLSLSSMARATLRGLGSMQAEFDRGVQGVPGADGPKSGQVVNRSEPVDPSTTGMEKAAQVMAEQIETATRAQEQLVRFVAASSVSSSLGRNLNMFLRGQ